MRTFRGVIVFHSYPLDLLVFLVTAFLNRMQYLSTKQLLNKCFICLPRRAIKVCDHHVKHFIKSISLANTLPTLLLQCNQGVRSLSLFRDTDFCFSFEYVLYKHCCYLFANSVYTLFNFHKLNHRRKMCCVGSFVLFWSTKCFTPSCFPFIGTYDYIRYFALQHFTKTSYIAYN